MAHVVTTFFDRVLGASDWLRGQHGPPFFTAALFMGLMYGGIGLTQRTWKGFAPFLGIALPLAVLERLFDLPWVNVVVAVYVVAVWGTIFLIGGWQAVAGAFAAFMVFSLIGALAPFLFNFPWKPGYLPQPQVLLDGLLTGLGIALGGAYARRRHA